MMHMKKRSTEILKYLANLRDKEITLEELKKEYQVSEKTIRKEMDDINFFLKMNGISEVIVNSSGKICLFDAEWDTKVLDMLKHIDRNSYVMNKEERIDYIKLCLLSKKDYMTMEQLAELLCVTRITVLKDMIEVTQEFEKENIVIQSKPGKGVLIAGEEYQFRCLMVKILLKNNFEEEQEFGLSKAFFYILLDAVYSTSKLETINNQLKQLEKSLQVRFSGRGFRKTLFYIYVTLNKMSRGEASRVDISKINHRITEGLLEKICEVTGIAVCEEEIVYLHRFIQENQVLIPDKEDIEVYEIQSMVANFLYQVSEELEICLYDDYSLFELLSLHLEQMNERVKRREKPIVNPALQDIQEQYPLVCQAVEHNRNIIESFYSIQIDEQEMSYIIMHLCADLIRRSNQEDNLQVLIIAPESVATGRLLKAQLEKYFNVKVKDIVTINHLAEEDESDVDMLISTVVLPKKEIPSVVVRSILDYEAVNKIQLMIFRLLQQKEHVLEKTIEDEGSLHDYRLYQTISPQLIQLQVSCKNCKEALRIGGKILVDQKYAWNGFADALVDSLELNGPYFVMRRGIAVAHIASKEPGYESAVSLITIKDGVCFGHEYHDPVYVLFCMNIRDANSYVKMLNDILHMIRKEGFLERMMEVTDSSQAYEEIKKMCLD